MKVKELIERLKKLDGQDLPVKVMVAATIEDEKVDSQVEYLFTDEHLSIRQDSNLKGKHGEVVIYGDLEKVLEA